MFVCLSTGQGAQIKSPLDDIFAAVQYLVVTTAILKNPSLPLTHDTKEKPSNLNNDKDNTWWSQPPGTASSPIHTRRETMQLDCSQHQDPCDVHPGS